MYSVVLVAAMATGTYEPSAHLCPVSPSVYGVSIWSKFCFFECCAPARYGWVDCHTKGFGYYPGIGHKHGWAGCGGCFGCAGFGCGGWGHHHSWGGYSCSGCGGWGVYGGTSFSVPGPWAHGAGYAGFSGFGNFGVYGAVTSAAAPLNNYAPMPSQFAPQGEYTLPNTNPSSGNPVPSEVRPPIPPAPSGVSPLPVPNESPSIPPAAPSSDKKPSPASVILVVPENSQVLVDGIPLKSTNSERLFLTPALELNKDFYYTVKVMTRLGEKEFQETQKVVVSGGKVTKVIFEEIISQVKAEQSIISTSGK